MINDENRGFAAPILLALIAALVVGGTTYMYWITKLEVPPVTNNEIVKSSPNQKATSTNEVSETNQDQRSINTPPVFDLHDSKSKWIGTSYCWDAPPTGTESVGNYNNLQLLVTENGKEVWATNNSRKVEEFPDYLKGCSSMNIVIDVLKYPPIGSGVTMTFDSCRRRSENEQILALVDEKQYMSANYVRVQPIKAWSVIPASDAELITEPWPHVGFHFVHPVFEEIPASGLDCYSFEPDPI
jgi:hypothetical protein